MTSCVFTLSFLLALFISNTAADDPTGVKIQVTDRGVDVLKDLGLASLDTLLNRDLGGTSGWFYEAEKVTLTSLKVNPDDVTFSYVEKIGVQFEINALACTGTVKASAIGRSSDVKFDVTDVKMNLIVKLNRNQQGHLNVEMGDCDINVEGLQIQGTNVLGAVLGRIQGAVKVYFNFKLCSLVQSKVVPYINTMLEKLTMKINLGDLIRDLNLNLHIDYSLSRNPEVTSHSLAVPFKGLVSFPGKTDDSNFIRAGAEPAFTETDRAVYVGISEFFFNSAALALYKSGEMIHVEKLPFGVETFAGLPEPPFDVKLSEAPIITISNDGFFATVKAITHSEKQPETVLSVTCQIDLNVNIKGSRLVLISRKAKCKTQGRSKLVKWAVNKGLKRNIKNYIKTWFDDGLPIPLPEGLSFTQGNINYYNGFMVVGGDLNFLPPDGTQKFLASLGI